MNSNERTNRIREIYLGIFKEQGISKEELKTSIVESYNDEGFNYSNFEDIPLKELEEAICDTCEAAGLKFENIDDILKQFNS